MTRASFTSFSTQLHEAYAHCESITRVRARNFFYGLKLLPQPQRSAMFAIYAWMRAADDLVDDSTAGSRDDRIAIIQQFRKLTDQALAAHPVNEPLWIAMADTAERFQLSRHYFHQMLDGQLDDIANRQYETFSQLAQYCHRVASVVGLLCMEVWGYSNQDAPRLAALRGVAFQLTNILRDYAQDYDGSRMYLPLEEFRRFEISPEQLRYWRAPEQCREFMACQIDRARRLYDESFSLDEMISSSCRPTLWAMTTIYRRLLSKIAGNPKRVTTGKRVRVSAIHKAGIAFRARLWAATATTPSSGVAHGTSVR